MEPSRGVVEGDLGESWEFSPDKLQLTIKLTDKAHFAPLAPVNGRVPDADDVTYSYQRLKAIGTRREELANDINPEAPVTSITAPDKRTIVVKFNEPLSTALNLFSNWTQVNLFIVPKESEDPRVLDLRRQFLGTGHWYLSEYTPSVRLDYKRNPGFGPWTAWSCPSFPSTLPGWRSSKRARCIRSSSAPRTSSRPRRTCQRWR
jgi:ABC-type transport system substrate-binding protein